MIKTAMEGWILTYMLFVANFQLALAECQNGETCIQTNQFFIQVNIDGNEIDINWTFNQTKTIYGFQTRIYNSDSSIVYESPVLHQSERSMTVERELDGKSKVCVAVYENSTNIIDEKCENIEITDLKIIIGILAGVIFLIPCIIGISFVIYKDYQNKKQAYGKLESDFKEKLDVNKKQVLTKEMKTSSKKHIKATKSQSPKDNKAFTNDEDTDQKAEKEHVTHGSTTETVTVHISNETVRDKASKKSADGITRHQKNGAKSEVDKDKSEVKNEVDDVKVIASDEDVTGTSL